MQTPLKVCYLAKMTKKNDMASSHQSGPVCVLRCSALRSDSAPRLGTVDQGPGPRRQTRWLLCPAECWPAECRWGCRESAGSRSGHQLLDPSSPTEHPTCFHCELSETPQRPGLKTGHGFSVFTHLQVCTVAVICPPPSPVRAQTDDWLLCSPLWVTTTI